MIIIKEKKEILIITDKSKNDCFNKYPNVDVLEIKIDKQSVSKINENSRENYNYILFIKECDYSSELVNYLPIYFIDNFYNKVFINEILVNPILIESIEIVMDSISVNEIAVILKDILRNDIKENDFNFYKEIHKIKKSHKCTNSDLNCLKKNIYHAIEKHYSQDSILRIIKFRFNKSNIIRKALYKTLDIVTYKLKRTNELILKELIGISIQLIKSNI